MVRGEGWARSRSSRRCKRGTVHTPGGKGVGSQGAVFRESRTVTVGPTHQDTRRITTCSSLSPLRAPGRGGGPS
eukprot:30602-Chlamydomonas_euryale.AAC.1